MITYKTHLEVEVFLDNRLVGRIRACEGGYAYFPKTTKLRGKKEHGDVFPDVSAVKRSLGSGTTRD